jgi:spore germination cell wall hydrolase CwlJ-like protein
MHMTHKLNPGMSKQKIESLLVKVALVALTFVIVVSAVAGPLDKKHNRAYNNSMTPFTDWVGEQLHGYENESWEQRVRRLMSSNLEEVGGTRKALADKQVRCLAENIYYESRGESLQGQVAVAKVTLNRLDEGYARTLCGVVKQGCQFSWVCNGGAGNPSGYLWNQAVGIAVLTINEGDKVEDPTNGATHFHATYINWQPGWKRVKDSVNRIGNHIFYRVNPKEEK